MSLKLSTLLTIPLSREICKWFFELGINLEVIFVGFFLPMKIINFDVFSLTLFELMY